MMRAAMNSDSPSRCYDLVLHYASHKIAGDTLTITLRDISNDLFVDLSYTADPESGIIRRSALIRP